MSEDRLVAKALAAASDDAAGHRELRRYVRALVTRLQAAENVAEWVDAHYWSRERHGVHEALTAWRAARDGGEGK